MSPWPLRVNWGEWVAFFPPRPGSGALVARTGAHQARRLSEAHAFCSEPLSAAVGTVFIWEDGERVASLGGSYVRAGVAAGPAWAEELRGTPPVHGQRRARGRRSAQGFTSGLCVATALSVLLMEE